MTVNSQCPMTHLDMSRNFRRHLPGCECRKGWKSNADPVRKQRGNTVMKLIRFTTADSPNHHFGVVIRDQAVPFSVLQSKSGKFSPHLADSRSYLANLPDSERAAKEMLVWGEQHLKELGMVNASLSTPSSCWNRWRSPPCSTSA